MTSILELQIKPDRVDDALQLLERVLEETRDFEGCEGVTVAQAADDPGRIVAVETWASLEADATYRKWRAGEGAITDLPPLLAGAPRLFVGTTLDS